MRRYLPGWVPVCFSLSLLAGCHEGGGDGRDGDAIDVAPEPYAVDPRDADRPELDATDPFACEVTAGPIESSSQITQHGITWTFDGEVPHGQFANGDYWVTGPVTITAITPEFNGANNGWQSNPMPGDMQGFDVGAQNFDPGLVPALPYAAGPGESLVKAVSKFPGSSEDCYPCCLKTAAVLTVVDAPPPDNGASVFRPPYVGTDKPYYSVCSLMTERLPSAAPVEEAPSLEWVVERFRRVQIQHGFGRTGRLIHPEDNMKDYSPDNAADENDAVLRLMLDDPVDEKMPALVAVVQNGIDSYHAVVNGQTWPAGGGYEPGHKLLLTFAAAMLDDEGMTNAVIDADFFNEDRGVYRSSVTGMVLYGFTPPDGSDKTRKDPDEVMDAPGAAYIFCCLAMPWKGAVLSVRLMPAMQEIWFGTKWTELSEFIDRWVDYGRWYPRPNCEGKVSETDVPLCDLDHADANGGYRVTSFQHNMWNVYHP